MFTKKEIEGAWELAHKNKINYFGAVGLNNKTIKSDSKTEYLSWIMYLAPHTQSGYNVCPAASKGCAAGCLFTAGHGRWDVVRQARIRRTKFFFEHKKAFKSCVFDEIQQHREDCLKVKRKPAVRLNGTSDIAWEIVWPQIFDYFPDIQFYEYTKIARRLSKNWKLPKNLHLTFSRSESNQDHIHYIWKNNPKANVTVVFNKLPEKWMDKKVINGDEHDARFLDPQGVIVGLKAKGDARSDTSGFVVRLPVIQ